jgi:type IV secretory pathway VirJ component
MMHRAAVLLTLASLACGTGPAPTRIEAGRLGSIRLYAPRDPPTALVFLISDAAGWSPAWDDAAVQLRAHGAAVVGVDLPSYLKGLRDSPDGCHYLISEIEDLSKRVQRELGSAAYQAPILAGAGAGGTLAVAALAQSPAATVAGAVAVDPSPALDTRVPLCPGAASRPAHGGGFTYDRVSNPPGFQRIETTAPGTAGGAPAKLAALVESELGTRGAPTPLADLPLVELPSAKPGPYLAVFFSGDGGWRDLDKTIGEILAREGVAVVGIDSLRYFWRARTPDGVASDLARILSHYGDAWGTKQVAVIGYSFGAGVIPFALNRLPAELRSRVVQVTLLGLEARAPFEFKVSGWLEQLGVESQSYADAPLVLPELARVDMGLVQCVYGEDETTTLCTSPELASAERIRTGGGHHFGGDYGELARKILAGMRRRAAARGEQAR